MIQDEMMNSEEQPEKGSVEAIDPFSAAPPGHSLTIDNTQWAWGKPPQFVDPEQVLDISIKALKDKRRKDEMLKLLLAGVSVEQLVEGFIFQGFSEGKFTPDVGMLIKAPLAIVIANMAETEGLPYRLFANKDAAEEGKMKDKTFIRMIKNNNPRMFEYIRENVNKVLRDGDEPMEENFLNMPTPTQENEE